MLPALPWHRPRGPSCKTLDRLCGVSQSFLRLGSGMASWQSWQPVGAAVPAIGSPERSLWRQRSLALGLWQLGALAAAAGSHCPSPAAAAAGATPASGPTRPRPRARKRGAAERTRAGARCLRKAHVPAHAACARHTCRSARIARNRPLRQRFKCSADTDDAPAAATAPVAAAAGARGAQHRKADSRQGESRRQGPNNRWPPANQVWIKAPNTKPSRCRKARQPHPIPLPVRRLRVRS
jgi:hypothetical protein